MTWSQNTPQTKPLHLKVELMLIYIYKVPKSFSRRSQGIISLNNPNKPMSEAG